MDSTTALHDEKPMKVDGPAAEVGRDENTMEVDQPPSDVVHDGDLRASGSGRFKQISLDILLVTFTVSLTDPDLDQNENLDNNAMVVDSNASGPTQRMVAAVPEQRKFISKGQFITNVFTVADFTSEAENALKATIECLTKIKIGDRLVINGIWFSSDDGTYPS